MEDKDDSVCRKGYHSLVPQGVVDANLKFTDVCTGFPGSLHDARVLRLSSFFEGVEASEILQAPVQQINGVDIRPLIFGDGAYPLKSWLMKPYPKTSVLYQSQKDYNKELSKLRVKVELAFGVLKGRWHCLPGELNEHIENAPRTILACCILHNVCIEMDVDFSDDDSDQNDDDSDLNDDDDDDGNNNAQDQGARIHEVIRRYLT